MDSYDNIFKLLLIGDTVCLCVFGYGIVLISVKAVGKSSLLMRFAEDAFDSEQAATIGKGRVVAVKLTPTVCCRS